MEIEICDEEGFINWDYKYKDFYIEKVENFDS